MADYREISQDYAQGAIKAVILINGGAAVALLSQTADLLDTDIAIEIVKPMMSWTLGGFLGAFSWVFGFMSTRSYDKFVDEKNPWFVTISNRWMTAGLTSTVASALCFMLGAMGFGQSIAGL